MKKAVITMLLILQSITATVLAQVGSPDTSFDTDGWAVMTPRDNLFFQQARSMAIQPDGKIVYVCQIYDSAFSKSGWGIVRLNPDGSLDTSFSSDGYVAYFGDSENSSGYPNAVCFTTDGKIVISGYIQEFDGVNYYYPLTVIRLLPDGNFDSSFDGDGIVSDISFSNYNFIRDLAIQPDGKIVLVGDIYSGAILKLNIDGSYDTGFDGDGIVYSNGSIGLNNVKLQSDGKIITTGYYYAGGYKFAVVRYNSNGTLDVSFGLSGLTLIDFGIDGLVEDFEIASDDKIVLGGYTYPQTYNNYYDFAIARLNADGTLDNSFDGDGKNIITISNVDNICSSVVLQTDGKILLGGYNYDYSNPFDYSFSRYQISLVRLLQDGSFDSSFDTDGILTVQKSQVNYSEAFASDMALQPDGKIVTCGYSYDGGIYGATVLRLHNDDTSYSITCPANIIVNATDGSCTTTVNNLDPAVVPNTATYSYTLSGATTGSGSGSASGLVFNGGVTTVAYTLGDDNTKTCSFNVTVNDTEIPTIVCSPDVVVDNTPGQCTGSVTLIPPTVNDNCKNTIGNALHFDGINDYVSIENTNLPAGNSPRSITAWIKTTKGSIGNIVSYGNGAAGENFNLGISGASVFVSSWVGPQYFVTASNVNDGEWHHVALSFDGTNAQTYVDGVLLDNREFLINTVLNTAKIGTRRDAEVEFFEGEIDEVSIWNVSLNQAQIQATMNSTLNAQSNLVALYHFNQGIAGGTNTGLATATESSGNNNNGTLNNFALNDATSNWVLGNDIINTLIVTNDAPTSFSIGNTTVTWTVTDVNNNSATCTQIVTVNDTEIPTIICTPDVIINNTPGLCSGTVTLIPPTVSDNCKASFGNALSFDGGYVDVPHNDLLNPINQLTVEAWVKRTSNNLQESLIEKYSNGVNTFGYLLRITPENKPFTMVLNASNQGTGVAGGTTILSNVWYHLAATFNRNTGVLKLYVNGILDGEVNGISGLPTTSGVQSLKIGARGDDAATRLTNGGIIDEARIWNIERSQAQIQANMNKELNAQAGLVALYHFNQGLAAGNNSASPGPAIDTATDVSGNGFNGTLNGFALTGATSNWVLGYVDDEVLSLTNDAPATYPVGVTIVTWTAIDESNNSAICKQTVTVIDTEAPYITAPTEFHYTRTANNGLCFYDVDDGEFDLIATDNCQLFSFFYNMENIDAGLSSSAGSLSGSSLAIGINTISWTAMDINGNSSTVSFEVEVLEGDITVAASDSEICNGESSQLTVSGATSYFWTPSESLSSGTGATVIATPTQTTTYMVTGTGIIAGCSVSKEITVTVNPMPVVSLGAYSPVCINATPFSLSGGLPLGGVYSGNGVSSGSFNPSVAGLGNHVVTYTYTDSNGCSNSVTTNIQVNGPIADAGLDKTVYIGYAQEKCVILSGSASGGLAPYTYLWNTGATTAKINVCPTVTTNYTLRVTDARGCFKTDDVVVTAIDISCGKNSVYVCHNNVTTCVKTNDVKMHLAHGDYLGTCNNAVSFAKKINTSIIENNDMFTLYPNPTTGSFTVEVCKNNVVRGAKLQVVNALGQIIYSKKAFKIEGCIKEIIELNHALPEGTYFINLIIGENVETKKLILTK